MPKYSKTKASKKHTKRSMYGGEISEKLQKFLADNGLLAGMDSEFSTTDTDDQVLNMLTPEQQAAYANLDRPDAAAAPAAEELDEDNVEIGSVVGEDEEYKTVEPYVRTAKIEEAITVEKLNAAGYNATTEQAEALKEALIKLNTSGYNRNVQEVLTNIQELQAALTPIVPRDGGVKRKSKKKVGGAAEELDTTRIYNTQGLIGSTIDPLQKADNYGSGADLIPQPFSSRGVGSLSSAQLDTTFINDITPPLGMIGGRKQKKVTRK